ncbi:MAG TPA: cupredoxin domain-containing protein [Casimicrobiaceae bacterium]|nr:cupredoxin domain-containing protein [Casimicrobiaceae bacterium]
MRLPRRKMLGFLGAAGCASLGATLTVRSQPAERVIKIRAYKFSYEPDDIVVKLNEPVVLELSSSDVPMGFNAPDFAVRATLIPGQTTHVRFVPPRAGTFVFHCDIFCGDGHEDMDGTIKVVA